MDPVTSYDTRTCVCVHMWAVDREFIQAYALRAYICPVSFEGTVSDQGPVCGIQTNPEPHWRGEWPPEQEDPEEPARACPDFTGFSTGPHLNPKWRRIPPWRKKGRC